MDAKRGTEGRYEFDGVDDLLAKTPVRVVRAFMEHVDKNIFPESHVDYELNAAMKNSERQVVTAIGSFHLDGGDAPIPFLMMISDSAAEPEATA